MLQALANTKALFDDVLPVVHVRHLPFAARVVDRFPQLYAYGISGGFMRPKIFWSWMLQVSLLVLANPPRDAPYMDSSVAGIIPHLYDENHSVRRLKDDGYKRY